MTRRREVFSTVNIVPYLDVMLVLLVIFMATTPVVQMGVNVDLPVGKAASIKTESPVVLSIDKQGKRYLQLGSENPQPIDDDVALEAWLKKRDIHPSRSIHLQADQSLSWQKVLSALVQVNQMGWSKVALMTQPAESDH